jgi:hypothetical protein
VAGPLEGNELVLIPMYAEMLRRPPPSRPFLNLLCFPYICLCAVSCERLLACPPLLSAYFLTPATGAVKPASHSHSARGPCRSTVGCLHLDPCPWSAPMQVAGAMRHPLSSSHALQHAGTPACSVILTPAPRVPVPMRSHGESPAMAGRGHCCIDGKLTRLATVAFDQMACRSSAKARGIRCLGSTSIPSS